MTGVATLAGYALIVACAVGLEVVAHRKRRLATFGDAVTLALSRWPVRVLANAGWLWLGWHLFVRVHWQ